MNRFELKTHWQIFSLSPVATRRVSRRTRHRSRCDGAKRGTSALLVMLVMLGIGRVIVAQTSPANPNVKEIVVVFKTHYDIGFTDLASKVIERYRTTFVDNAMKVIDASRRRPANEQFVWTIPGWPLKEMLWAGQTPERRAEIVRALKEGRLVVHGYAFNTEDESMDLEDLVRGLKFSVDIAKEYGLPIPRAVKMTDVPEHTWTLETTLKHAGINFLMVGCNGGSTPMQVPTLFWWQGPDGSKLLTCYSPNYGTEVIPPADWPYHTWLAMIMAGDNHGPPTAKMVSDLLQQVHEQMPGVKIKFGRLEDFYDAISAEKDAKIPTVRGDMPDTWIHGLGSMPAATAIGMSARPMETTAGVLDTELRGWGLNPPAIRADLNEAYEESLLFGEHTFGLHGSQPGGFRYGQAWIDAILQNRYVRFQESFEDKKDYIRKTAEIVDGDVSERLRMLGQNINKKGERIVVFNPLSWKRSGDVAVDLMGDDSASVRDLTTGKEIWAAMMDDGKLHFRAEDVPAGGYKTYEPTNAPFPSIPPPASQTEISNEFFHLKADAKNGCLASLVDARTGRELIAASPSPGTPARSEQSRTGEGRGRGNSREAPLTDSARSTSRLSASSAFSVQNSAFEKSPHPSPPPEYKGRGKDAADSPVSAGFGEYLHQRFSPAEVASFIDAYCRKTPRARMWVANDFGKPGMPDAPHADMTLRDWDVSVQQDMRSRTLVMQKDNAAPLAKSVTIKYTLYDDEPYLDMEWSVVEKTPNPVPEGGWICLSFAVDHPTFHLGRMGSIINPATDIIDAGNRRIFCLNSGMTITGSDGFGIGICTLDSPLVSIGEPGLWKFSMHEDPALLSKSRVFVNLYNNQWNTNFPLWVYGTWKSRVRIWTIREPPDVKKIAATLQAADARSVGSRLSQDAKNLIMPGWEARMPLQAVLVNGPGGKLPLSASGLSISQPGVLVTNFGPDPYSDHVLLRLWEQAGDSGECHVQLPAGMAVKRALPVDFRGEPEGPAVDVIAGGFNVRTSAFAPLSFELQ